MDKEGDRFNQFIGFVNLANKMSKIERVVHSQDEERWENDAEHSFQLALTGWYLIDANDLDLNINKVIQYSLVHDLVEIHAGDTYVFAGQEELETKKRREEKAAELLQSEFPEFSSMHSLIQEYEKRDNAESRFVYALDKLLPIVNIYLNNGRTWHEMGTTLSQLIDDKTKKINLAPEIIPYYETLIEILMNNQKLFTS